VCSFLCERKHVLSSNVLVLRCFFRFPRSPEDAGVKPRYCATWLVRQVKGETTCNDDRFLSTCYAGLCIYCQWLCLGLGLVFSVFLVHFEILQFYFGFFGF
jgi:hypothetical protein